MSAARFIVGDVFEVLATLDTGSVHSAITSPPYWRKRAYLPADHPDKAKEIGQEPSPGEFLATLLRVTDELWRVVRDDGTIWINLGDTAAGSGGAGGDYLPDRQRNGQNKYSGTASVGRYNQPTRMKADIPLAKSVCWIPQLFGASLAYGRNLLTGEPCRQWITRPPVTWCKPSVTPGRCDDRFRVATELIVWGSKQLSYYWDKEAILEPLADSPGNRYPRKLTAADKAMRQQPGTVAGTANTFTGDYETGQSEGVPPLDWWVVSTSGYDGAHFATFPAELIRRPVIASCPPGGTILDPFGGSGTTAMVATGNGRDCISIDLDGENADLARERVGGLFFEVEHLNTEPAA